MPIVITVSHIVVSEYNTNAVFTVRLSEADPLNLVTVNWSLSGMTADSGSDFTYLSGLLSFDPGVVEQTISVPIIDDAFAESPETFQLNLYAPSTNAEIGNSVAVATIIDNDAAAGTPVVQVGDAVVDEATGLVQVALLLDRPSLDAVTVNCAVQEATAAAASDFTVFPAATIAFAPGETVKLVTVGILDDATVESTEVFDIVLSNVIGATVGDGRGHVFINGNDQQPELSPVVDLRNAVAVEGQGYVDFLVTLSSPGASVVSVNYQTVAGTAASYDDFISQAGTLTFSPGETIKTVRVSTVDDAVVEGQEAFTLQLYSPTNATLGSAVGTATILDNDGPPPSSANLDGGTAADILRGTSFADAITGGDGDDVLDGAGGDDSLSGGAGDDTYLIEDAGDSYSEAVGEGTDLVISYLPTLTLGAHVENLQLAGSAVTGIGNALDNRMTGSVANNTLEGGAGNDTLDGGAGLDTASYAGAAGGVSVTLASPGVQQNTIGAGLDTLLSIENLTGSALDDQLTGTTGANRLTGGAGNDLLDGGSGADSLLGGLGNDTYIVDDAGDVVVEDPGAGTDTVQSSVGRSLGANQENLTLTGVGAINGFGNSLDNLLQGNSAANYLDGGTGADTMAGGLGNDTYIVDNAGDVVTESDSAGTDTTRTSVDGYTLTSNVEWLVLTGTANISGNGNGLNNYLIGNTGHNTLDGGVGADTMSGGAGNDTYLVDNAADVISELSGEGTDTVRSSVTRTLGAYQDNLILTGSTAIDGSGNSEANVLTGNANNNVLDGGAGADTMTGGAGDDTYVVDHTGDVITEYVGQGIDTIQSTVSRGLGSYQENLTLTGSSATNGYGNSLANVITGNGAANYLDGGTGADTLSGGLGDDTYIVDHVGDVVTENSGAGKDTVRTALDGHLLENNVEWLVLTGTAHLSGYGNGLNNYLIGNTGNNTLDGGVGADTMTGGIGDDTYFVDNTGDIISELAGQGIDTVRSTISRSLGSNQENLTLTGASAINGYGNTLANTLIGNDAANYLDGATGADTMSGGLGDDTYIVDNVDDVVTEGSGAGKDTVRTSLTGYILTDDVEWLVLTGTAHIAGFGNGLNNYLIGNTGNNTLDGGVGADTMTGGVGNDTYFVDNTGDIISELAGQGTDTVISSVTRYLGSNQENLTLTGASALNGYGSNDDNFLQGNSAANLLSGGGGADTLAGGAGSDTIDGGSGDDRGVYKPSAAGEGDTDTYKGNVGSDTLSLELTQAELNSVEVQADLRAYEEFLRLNANAAVASGAEFQFTAFALKASGWEHLEVTGIDGMVWRNGTAGVTIGSAAAPTSFDIGTNAGTPTGDIWTGALPSGNDNWSILDNWQDISVPSETETVIFNAIDSGGRSVVDPAFQGTIAGLVDTGEAAHALEFERMFQVNGPVSIHTANAEGTGALTVLDTQVTLHLTDFNVGYNPAGSGTATGYLILNGGAVIDATDVDVLSIGREAGASDWSGTTANGSLTLASNSALHLGTAASLAMLNIGWSQNGNTYYASGSATGVLDALVREADVDLHLSELNVGRGSFNGFGTGTLKWDQTEVIAAQDVYFGRGNATGNLEVAAGGEFHLGTDTEWIANLCIAYNDAARGTATADLDFSVSNPTVTAFVLDDLSIGRETGAADWNGTTANGSLTLASNSTLHLGTAASLATLNIGWSQNGNTYYAGGSATGVLDASQGSFTADLSTLIVGQTANVGTASGTFVMGAGSSVNTNVANIGLGAGASGTLRVEGGALNFTGTDSALNFGTAILQVPSAYFEIGSAAAPISNLRIGYNAVATGTATTHINFATTNPSLAAFVASDLSIGRETGAADWNGTTANGSLTLASNSALHLGTAASLAMLNIGWSQNGNTYYASGSATGVLDALVREADVDLHLSELNVGRGSFNGFGTGTLKWDQTEVIAAQDVYFGRGNATGNLEVAAGGEFHLGTDTEWIANLCIAYNDAARGTATADLDFSVSNPTVTAFVLDDLSIGRETGAADWNGTTANGSLTLASNSALHLGTAASLATLNIGWSQNGNTYYASGSATGVLDALVREADVDLHLSELNVGRGSFNGFGTGTLKWDQTEVIAAQDVYFGRGNATGNLEVAAGGEFHLGTDTEWIANLCIAYNDAARGTATADLDFSVSNPTVTAFVLDDLSIGRETGAADWNGTTANGSLTLASNSTLHLGTAASLATLNIGWSQNGNTYYAGGSATGMLDAAEGAMTAHLSDLNVGITASAGTAKGTLVMGSGTSVDAQSVNIGVGASATGLVDIVGGTLQATTLTLASGTLDLNANPLTVGATGTLNAQTLDLAGGLLTGQSVSLNGGTFNFSGGVLSVDTFNGLLDQNGGVLAPGNSVGQTTVNGNYDLASAGTVKIEIFGSTFNTTTKLYDRLAVNGTVNLNGDSNPDGGGTLDVDLGYSPSVGSNFTILDNNGTDAVSGRFNGLLEGASFNTAYGSQTVTFQISYSGGTGNDVVLTVTGKTGVAPTGLTIDGSADNDLLSGSVGADTFTGFAGNDIFTGGAGNDLFIFDVGCGFDRINDFSPGGDDIQLSLALAADFAALDSNGNSVLDDADANVIVAGSDTILLFGSDQIDIVGQTALHSSDFVFV